MVHGRLIALFRHLAAWALGRRRLLRIAGSSMAPGLRPGDLAWWKPRRAAEPFPAPGQVVLVRHPYRRDLCLVKRVAGRSPEGALYVLGDAPDASTDSRHFGPVPPDRVLGLVFPFPG